MADKLAKGGSAAIFCGPRVYNPAALFQNRDYGAERPQNRDPGARTGIHSSMKKTFFSLKNAQNITFFGPKI
jgi:hypothetical protein